VTGAAGQRGAAAAPDLPGLLIDDAHPRGHAAAWAAGFQGTGGCERPETQATASGVGPRFARTHR
jgi:hypothetical protein